MNNSFVVGSVALSVSDALGTSLTGAADGVSMVDAGYKACEKNMPVMFECGMRGEYAFPPTVAKRDTDVEFDGGESTLAEVYEIWVAFLLLIGFSGYGPDDYAEFVDPATGWRAPKGKKSKKVSAMLTKMGEMRQRIVPTWVSITGEKVAPGSKVANAMDKAKGKKGKAKGKDDKAPLTPMQKMETALQTAIKVYANQENPSPELKELHDAVKQLCIDFDIATEKK